jgi:hypothetical protein
MMPNSPPPLEYATKADLALLRQEIRADLAELKADITTALSELEIRLQRLVLTTLIGLTAIFGGLVTVLKLFG